MAGRNLAGINSEAWGLRKTVPESRPTEALTAAALVSAQTLLANRSSPRGAQNLAAREPCAADGDTSAKKITTFATASIPVYTRASFFQFYLPAVYTNISIGC